MQLFRFVPSLLWMGVIFFLSSRQKLSVSESHWLNFLFFKALHVCEYAFLGVTVQYGFRGRSILNDTRYSDWLYSLVSMFQHAKGL
jgi:VanZ family protein